MPIESLPTPRGNIIFCDDFRVENNGKFMFIGAYQSEMIVYGVAPVALSAIWAIVRYYERSTDSDDDVLIKVFLPGSDIESVSIPLNKQQWKSASIPPKPDYILEEDYDPVMQAFIPISISPFVVEKEGVLKIRAFKGDKIYRLGALHVKLQPLPAVNSTPPSL